MNSGLDRQTNIAFLKERLYKIRVVDQPIGVRADEVKGSLVKDELGAIGGYKIKRSG